MKAITISTKDICQEFNGKLGKITYHSVTFSKDRFPKAAATKARNELSKLGITGVNVYDRKPKEFAVEKKLFEQYLKENGVSYSEILEPFVKIECV